MACQRLAALSRREALCGGLLACLAAGYLRLSQAADSPSATPLITKTVPSSGEKIPAIGLGADSFRASESDAIRDEIKRMNELGGSVIDTAAAYGDSEAKTFGIGAEVDRGRPRGAALSQGRGGCLHPSRDWDRRRMNTFHSDESV